MAFDETFVRRICDRLAAEQQQRVSQLRAEQDALRRQLDGRENPWVTVLHVDEVTAIANGAPAPARPAVMAADDDSEGRAPRTYAAKVCCRCGVQYAPTGPRQERCDPCRKAHKHYLNTEAARAKRRATFDRWRTA